MTKTCFFFIYFRREMMYCIVLFWYVSGWARGLGASMGKSQRHPLSRPLLVEGRCRERAVHPRANISRQHRRVEEAAGAEIRQDVVPPSRTSWLHWRQPHISTSLLPESHLCVAARRRVEMLTEVSSWQPMRGQRKGRVPLQVWVPPQGITLLWLNKSLLELVHNNFIFMMM